MAAPLPPESLRALFRPATDSSSRAALLTLAKAARAASTTRETCVYEIPGCERWILNVRYAREIAPPEQHRDWHDLSLYLAGGNDGLIGGTLERAEETSDGEWRNGTLTGGTVFHVRPGDLLWTPAGIPHQSHFLPHTALVIVKLRMGKNPSFPLPAGLTTSSERQYLIRFHNLPETIEVRPL